MRLIYILITVNYPIKFLAQCLTTVNKANCYRNIYMTVPEVEVYTDQSIDRHYIYKKSICEVTITF